MRVFFVYIAVALWLVAILVGLFYVTNPGSDTLVGSGGVFPDYNFTGSDGIPTTAIGLPFGASGANTTTTYTVSYTYGNTTTTLAVYDCPGNAQSVKCYAPYGGPVLTLTGAKAQGSFNGRVGQWFIIFASDPVRVNVNIPQTPSATAEEVVTAGAAVGGMALFSLGMWLRDPLSRPTPRLAQTKRTLYFFFQSKLAVLGLSLLIFYILVALTSPLLAPYSPPGSGACLPPGCNGDYVTLPVYTVYEPWQSSLANVPTPFGPQGAGNDFQCVFPSYATQNIPPGNCVPYDAGTASNPSFTAQTDLIPPTWSLYPFNPGPVPMGSLAITSGSGGAYIDIFQGLVRATPWDLAISAGIVVAGAMIGMLLGTTAGYLGGVTDEVIMRVTDVFLSIPGFLLILVIMASLLSGGTHIPNDNRVHIAILMGAFIITWWPTYTRIIRGQVLVTREQKYVEAARASGARSGRILQKHIIPNSVFPMMVQISLDVGSIPLALGGIAFLGFTNLLFSTPTGAPFPEWGILSSYEVGIGSASGSSLFSTVTTPGIPFPWWELLWPGLALFLFCIAVNFLSDGLRDALDPRLRR